MSADLLRRAAVALRTHAEAATGGEWTSLDDGDRLVALRADGSFDYVVDEPMSNADNAALIALLGPPVAVALADLLDGHAESLEQDGGIHESYESNQALEVAAAVLREPSGGAG